MEPTTPTSQYKAIAQMYFDGLAEKDLSAVPWAEDAAFRAPLNPKGGAEVPILGKTISLLFSTRSCRLSRKWRSFDIT